MTNDALERSLETADKNAVGCEPEEAYLIYASELTQVIQTEVN